MLDYNGSMNAGVQIPMVVMAHCQNGRVHHLVLGTNLKHVVEPIQTEYSALDFMVGNFQSKVHSKVLSRPLAHNKYSIGNGIQATTLLADLCPAIKTSLVIA